MWPVNSQPSPGILGEIADSLLLDWYAGMSAGRHDEKQLSQLRLDLAAALPAASSGSPSKAARLVRADSNSKASRHSSGEQLPPLPESSAEPRTRSEHGDPAGPQRPAGQTPPADAPARVEGDSGLVTPSGQTSSATQSTPVQGPPMSGNALSPALRAVRQYIGVPYTKGQMAAAFRDLLRLVSSLFLIHPARFHFQYMSIHVDVALSRSLALQ